MAQDERMSQVVIAYPEDIPQALKLSEREFGAELAFLAAAKLYELGRLSADRAARLAGLAKLDFLARLSRVGIPAINLDAEEIAVEIAAAKEIAGESMGR